MAKLKPGLHEDERETHKAFGMVSLSTISSSHPGINLFGSSVRHHHFISLEVHTAERVRALHHERAYSRDLLLEVRLSPVQLSELLTSTNTAGVPCTLRYYRNAKGKIVDAGECPETGKAQKTYAEFGGQVQKATDKMRAMQERLRKLAEAGKPIGKKALERLVIDFGVAAQEVDSNLPFILKSFAEACASTVRDAKGEVEAFLSAKVEATGIAALRDAAPELPLLEGGKKE